LRAAEVALKERYREAIPLLQEATRQEPQNYWAWSILGICHDRIDQAQDALACHTACVVLAPDDPWGFFNRGLVRYRSGEYVQAQADFDRALRLQDDIWEAWLNRGLARQQLKDYAGAIADLTRALDLGAPATRLYFLRARVRDWAGDREGAQRDRNEGFRREPTDEASWVARGLARLPKDLPGALADYKKALELNPRCVQAWQCIANALGDEKEGLEEAIQAETRALALAPDYAFAWSGRGILLARQGHRAAAHADAEEALKVDDQPKTRYQVAGIYALTSRQEPADRARAFDLLSAALRNGFGHDLLKDDPDLNPLRADPEFRRLEAAAQALQRRASQPK